MTKNERSVLGFFAAMLKVVAFLMIGLGGLCTLGSAIMATYPGPGHWTLWAVPSGFFATATLAWFAGRRLEKRIAREKRGRE